MNTLFVGRYLLHLQRIGSTNNYATSLLRESSVPEGTIVLADEQTSGRGQRGNTWDAKPSENLTFSVIFFPSFLQVRRQYDLSRAIALAVHDLVQSHVSGVVRIKWPNDILVDERKVSGILIESAIRRDFLQHAIAGIGLNVNQQAFSDDFRATSLALLAGHAFDLEPLLHELCAFLEARYLQLKNRPESLAGDYLNRLFAFNEWRDYEWEGQRERMKITGVASDGLLELERENGEQLHCNFQEIKYLYD